MITNPEYILIGSIPLLVIIDYLFRVLHYKNFYLHYITAFLIALSLIFDAFFGNAYFNFFQSMQFSRFVIGFTLFTALSIYLYIMLDHKQLSSSFDIMFMSALLGAVLVIIASNFISIIVGFEILSISSYALVFFGKSNIRLEGSMKFMVTSFIAILSMIFGASVIFAGNGSLSLPLINLHNYITALTGLILFIVGLSFESTLVPFHIWAPDVYEAADSSFTAFLSSVSKTAGLIAIIRISYGLIQELGSKILPIFIILAVLTLSVSTLLALIQKDVKKILIYSSIAQAGFAFVGISMLNSLGISAAVFYIFTFSIADALVFISNRTFEERGINKLAQFKNSYNVSKIATIGMVVGILSLTGFPPTIGFIGKLLIFRSLIISNYIWYSLFLLIIIMASAFYYFRIIVNIIPGYQVKRNKIEPKDAIIIALLLTIFLGIIFV